MYGGAEASCERSRAMRCGRPARSIRDISYGRVPGDAAAPGAGVVISVVGLDGSGKSTLVREIRRWLGAEVDVMSCLFWHWRRRAVAILSSVQGDFSLGCAAVRTRPKGASHGVVSDRPPGLGYSMLFAVWAVAVAIDKRQKIVSTQRAARRGFVVVTDRYPQNEIPGFNDGPLLHRLPRCPAWLRRLRSFPSTSWRSARRRTLIHQVAGRTGNRRLARA